MRVSCIGRGVLCSLLVVMCGCSGEQGKPVARFGDHEILSGEFLQRYEMYLHSTGARDNILVRKQVLDNMISETLILDDFHARGLDRHPDFLRRMEEVRRQALLDRYARSITTDTLTVSEEELAEEFRASRTKVEARYLFAETREGAIELKRRADGGESFGVLSREVFSDPGLASNGGYLGTFGWGEMDPELERAAFQTPVGRVSDPVRIANGWAIVKVESRVRNPLGSEIDYGAQKEKLRRVVLQRKVDRTISEAADGIADDLQAEFDPLAVRLLDEDRSWLDPGTVRVERPGPFTDEQRAMPLVTFGETSWTVGDFIERSSWLTERQRRRVRSAGDIEAAAKGLATREALLRRAREKGFESDPEVRQQIERMEKEIRLKRWAAAVEDTIGAGGWPEPALRALYDSLSSEMVIPPQVRVSEVLVRTRAEAEDVLERIRRGAAFADVARERSIRLWAAEEGGDLGWGTESAFGILGKRFLSSRVGDVIGPEFVDPYYGVFIITGRRAGRPLGFDEARPALEDRFAAGLRPIVVRERIGALRTNLHIRIDLELLGNLELPQQRTAKDHTP